MPLAFQSTVVVTNDNKLVAISCIESMKYNLEEEDRLIDKLKDDLTIEIITISGAQYSLSIRYQMMVFKNRIEPVDVLTARQTIVEKWFRILG